MPFGSVGHFQERIAGPVLIARFAGVGPSGGSGAVEAVPVCAENKDLIGSKVLNMTVWSVTTVSWRLADPLPIGCGKQHISGWVRNGEITLHLSKALRRVL